MKYFPSSHNYCDDTLGKICQRKKESTTIVIQELVENAFDILAARWRILLSPIRASVKNVEKYVCACLAQLFTANW